MATVKYEGCGPMRYFSQMVEQAPVGILLTTSERNFSNVATGLLSTPRLSVQSIPRPLVITPLKCTCFCSQPPGYWTIRHDGGVVTMGAPPSKAMALSIWREMAHIYYYCVC